MTDVRKGLQRRYDLETILESHEGIPKIQGLNYHALTMLRNSICKNGTRFKVRITRTNPEDIITNRTIK